MLVVVLYCLTIRNRDGLEGFVTITGGKLMTYRLMAEWATDLVSKKLRQTNCLCNCPELLPGSESDQNVPHINKIISLPTHSSEFPRYRHGQRASRLIGKERLNCTLVCECEAVTAGEVRYAVEELKVNNLVDLRVVVHVWAWGLARLNFVLAVRQD